jgi:hypothetical protein
MRIVLTALKQRISIVLLTPTVDAFATRGDWREEEPTKMADHTIDFKKVDAAFQHLADSKDGNTALETLSRALTDVGKQSPGLNEHETHFLLTNLVQQRQGGFGANLKTPAAGARVKSGFLIKTAVPE